MKKELIGCLLTILAVCLLFSLLLLIPVLYLRSLIGENWDYAEAKASTLALFERRREEFLEVRDAAVTQRSGKGLDIKGVESIRYEHLDETQAVDFTVGSQGFLDGQYWGLYYVSDDQPLLFQLGPDDGQLEKGPDEGCYYYRGYFRDTDFYATEKIEDNWYFYYMDTNGNRHGLDWDP